jgi:hypothetical protein
MPSRAVNRMIDRTARKVPGLRKIPMLRLLALAEIAVLAQDHLGRLDPPERRRLVTLLRTGRGRRSNLTLSERNELSDLVAKVAPREFAAASAQKLSPVPIPDLIVRRVGGHDRH